jgi:Putative beta-barrel porin-2, OmpL-like. bbp2
MNKTYGVCLGLLALGLVGLGAPASRAESRLAAGETGGGSETTATSTASSSSAPTASSPADLRQRIDALNAELADLNKELAAEKDGDSATSAAPPQDQGAPPAATPAAAPAAAAPMPLPTPSMSGPLATGIAHELPAGPFGKIEITGILSGIGLFGNNPVVHGDEGHVDVSNAQVFIQKTSGWFQFFAQGGAYNIPVVGVPFVKTGPTTTGTYGPFPVGYVKLVKGNFNVEVGSLPTLIGDEYTFTFQNMNIERGLLWNQEPAISRGIQINDTYKKLTLSFSWNDGFYSDRYTSLTGLLAYAVNAANTITFAAGGNAGNTYVRVGPANSFPVTPSYQNNEQVYNLIYTYTKGNVTISPYYQYTVVKSDPIYSASPFFLSPTGAHTNGGALLANYNFKHGFSLAVRPEYIKSSGSVTTGEANLLGYGSGTGAFSFTVTPTWVKDAFFLRGDVSIVHLTNFVAGSSIGFGIGLGSTNQARGAIEAGFMF